MAKQPTKVAQPARTAVATKKSEPVKTAPKTTAVVAPKPAPKPASAALTVMKTNTAFALQQDAFDSMGGVGLENVTAKDLMIPRLSILQALSPQLQKSKPEFIEGAQQADFCDTGTGEIFRDEITVIPCFFARVFLEWAPRATGKGLVKNHGTDDSILDQCTPDDKGRQCLPNGNYIAETATFYCLNLSAGGRRSFIPMASTQLRAARRWMTLITAEKIRRANGTEFTPPIFYRAWSATPVEQSNAEGTWYGWKFEASTSLPEMEDGASLLAEAKDFYEQVRSGQVTGDVASMVGEDAAVNAGTNGGAM